MRSPQPPAGAEDICSGVVLLLFGLSTFRLPAEEDPRMASSADAVDLVASTREPSFAVDEMAFIIAWNRAAELLLGVEGSEAIGKPCHEVVRGRDIFRNRFCGESCAIASMARRREPARHFELDVPGPCGDGLRVSIFPMVLRDRQPGRFAIVHLVQEMKPKTQNNDITAGDPVGYAQFEPPFADRNASILTRRETEVLRRLEQGARTEQIARSLGISVKTVRNHIQNVFTKLDAHNRLEAVCVARRRGLI
jgi:DNA-binding CsgD family transcriptional regulator